MGIPVQDFDRFLWVVDSPGAGGGTAGGGDLFIAAQNLTQQIVSHEIAHALGVAFEGDIYVNGAVQTYGDPFCPMDRGPSARSFQNSRMAYTQDGNSHLTTGPVMCAAHTFVMKFLDYQNNVVELAPGAPDQTIVIEANQGAPAAGDHRKIGLVISPVNSNGRVQFWTEYRAPIGFDRWIDRPVSTQTIDMPQGAVVIHELRPDRHVILVGSIPAITGKILQIPSTGRSLEVVHVDGGLRHVTLLLRAA